MEMRIVADIDAALRRPLADLAFVERRTLRDQAAHLLELKIAEAHQELLANPARLERIRGPVQSECNAGE